MKKTYLMFALLLSLMGVNGALADSVTDDFTSYSATSSGQTLGDNWYVYPGEDGNYGRFGSDYTYKKNEYDGADFNYVSGYSSNYSKNVWLVLKKQVSGSVSFRSKMAKSTGTIYVTNKVTAVGDGTFTVDKTGAQSYSISTTTSSNTYSAGDAATYVAFCIASDQLRLLDVTYTEFEKSDGPALKVSGDTDGALNFGMVNPGATKTLTLSNPGTASITVGIATTGGFTANPTSATIAAGEQQTLTISAPETTATGEVTITPTVAGVDAVTVTLSATVKDPNKVFETLATGSIPEDWTSTSWSFTTGYAYTSSWYESSNARLITPLLTVKEGEVFMIEAMGTYSGYQTFFIEYSADKTNWTKSATAITLGSDWATYSVSDIPAGKYYIAIHASQARVRNFYGGELPMEAKMVVTQPESLDFGIVDATATKTFTIANTGRAELTGISVASSGETFTIAGAPSTLAAGESAEVSINMSAAATGVFSSTITVSAEGQESVTFDVTGIVLPEGLSVIDFNDNKLPNGWELTSSNKWSFSDGKAYATSVADMVTSELELSQGDMIVIKASSYDNYDNNYLTISGSADGGATWTAYSKKFVSRSQIPYGSYATLVINDVPATVNKLKFTGYYVRVDEIDGLTFNQNAPVMSLDNTTAAFGTVKAQPEDKLFTVTNSGTGTLSVAIASDSEDFTVAPATLEDIAAGESKTFTVHFNFAEPWGEKTANITVTPSYDPTAAVTIAASATSKDPNVWEEDFEAGIPSEWTNSGWTISRKWSEESSVNHAYSGSSNSNTLVTPRLFATEGAVLEFEVIDAEENYPLTVEYSSDMQNWTEYGKITESGTATFTAPAEGAYYLRFSGRYIYLDNFSGFKLDLLAADAAISASTLPATGNQFVAYNASVTVENKGTEAQVAVAKLLVNGEEKDSQEAELAVAASATIDLSFVPEEAITDGTATIEVTLKDVEDFAAKTVEATINIAAAPVIDETAENSFTTGILPVAVLNYTAKNGWNTIGVPFQLTNDILTTIFGEGWKAYELTGYSNNEISFSQTTTFVAGYPYIIYAEAAPQEASFKLENLNIGSATEREDVKSGLAFRSTFAPIAPGQLTDWWGVTNEGRIRPAGSGASLKALRGYFYMNASAPDTNLSEARIVYINLDGTVTAISSVKAQLKADGNTYDLSGRKLTGNLKQGVYIQNGKKIVIK